MEWSNLALKAILRPVAPLCQRNHDQLAIVASDDPNQNKTQHARETHRRRKGPP